MENLADAALHGTTADIWLVVDRRNLCGEGVRRGWVGNPGGDNDGRQRPVGAVIAIPVVDAQHLGFGGEEGLHHCRIEVAAGTLAHN